MRRLLVRLFGSRVGFAEYLAFLAACVCGMWGLVWWQGNFSAGATAHAVEVAALGRAGGHSGESGRGLARTRLPGVPTKAGSAGSALLRARLLTALSGDSCVVAAILRSG